MALERKFERYKIQIPVNFHKKYLIISLLILTAIKSCQLGNVSGVLRPRAFSGGLAAISCN